MPDLCCFRLDCNGWKKIPVVQKVVQVMIVTASGGAFVPDFKDRSISCLGVSEVSSTVNSVRSFLGLSDVAAYAFFDDKMLSGCVEVAQKIKRLQDRESASPW